MSFYTFAAIIPWVEDMSLARKVLSSLEESRVHVELIAYTPEPETVIASAARLSYSSSPAHELPHKLSHSQTENLLRRLLASSHLSPFEHASFTFAIEGISRVTSHQLVRHRLASYTQQSQRYVSLRELEYVTPSSISKKQESKARFDEAVEAAHELYCWLVDSGVPVEDARYVLPQAVTTQLIMTMNCRELMHAASLRLCLRAQWEILDLFQRIKDEVGKVAPFLGSQLQPKCYDLGYCDERESCGLFPVRSSPSGSEVSSPRGG